MSFLLPHFLWALLGLIPLALAYLIKVHPMRRKTSAWFLWEGVFQEHRAASLLQKLRDWLSLLLMALAFILMVLSLAQPVWSNGGAAERLVLIIDSSLSMSADGRLAGARRAAQGMVRSLPTGGRAAVFSLNEELISSTGFTASRRELMRGLDRISASDAPLNIGALEHFSRDEQSDGDQRILFFTDGCFEGADRLPEGIERVGIGQPEKNVGIVAFDARRIPGADRPLGVFFRVLSSADETVQADAILSYENAESVRRIIPLDIDPGLNEPEILTIPGGETGRWLLTLEYHDALARDNTAYAVVPEVDPVRVAVQAPETHAFWQLCVEAFGDGVNRLQMVEDQADLELYRGAVNPEVASRIAVFAPSGESPFWAGISGEEMEATARVVLSDHPLVRYANMEGIVLNGIRQIKLPEQAIVVAETDGGVPLIYKTTQDGTTAYVFNFDPAQNAFFLNPLFPVLVWSTASELMELEEASASSVPAGAMARLPSGFSDGVVETPSGEILNFSGAEFGPLEAFGFYAVASGDQEMTVACSPANAAESQLTAAGDRGETLLQSAGFPLSDWFMAGAVLILALECALYHRRKVG